MAHQSEYESKSERINYKNYKNQEREDIDSLLNEITYSDQMRLKIPLVQFAMKPKQLFISFILLLFIYFFFDFKGERTLFTIMQSFLPYNIGLTIILYFFSNEKYEDVLN